MLRDTMTRNDRKSRSPYVAARRYVYSVVATTLEEDISNGSEWIFEGDDKVEIDLRLKAIESLVKEFRRKAGKQ